MKNKNALIGAAAAMLAVVILCVFTVVYITKPDTNDTISLSSGDNVANISNESLINDSSKDVESNNSTGDSDSSDIVVEPTVPDLVLPPGTTLHSKSIVVYDVAEDAVIFELLPEHQMAPASLTKMVTALVALDHLSPTKTITVGEEIKMIGANSSTALLSVGQKYSVKSLLDALLIPSGNDAAYVLAVNAARTAANDKNLSLQNAVSDFVRLMNAKAEKLGCQNTHFSTPDGYDAEGQYTTALDMVKISSAAIKDASIRDSVIKGKSGGWENSNLLVRTDSSYYNKYATGLKTGSTTDAGYCVSVSATIHDKPYIMVFMNSPTRDGRFKDANTIISLLEALNAPSE